MGTTVDATTKRPAHICRPAIRILTVPMKATGASAATTVVATTKICAGVGTLQYLPLPATARSLTKSLARIRQTRTQQPCWILSRVGGVSLSGVCVEVLGGGPRGVVAMPSARGFSEAMVQRSVLSSTQCISSACTPMESVAAQAVELFLAAHPGFHARHRSAVQS